MSRKSKEAIVLVMDFGKTMAEKCFKSDETVFESSKRCLQHIIRQKIFAETKNEYLLVQYSTNGGHNGLKINGSLRSPTFDLLLKIQDINYESEKGCEETNVMDVLNSAITAITDQTRGQKFSELKIGLFTNFGQLSDYDLKRFQTDISHKLSSNGIQLIVLCDFTPECYSGRDLSKSQLKSIELMKIIEEKKVGFCYQLQDSVQQFSLFEGRIKIPYPWYSNLSLGSGVNAISIPIGAYIKAEAYQKKTGSDAYIRSSQESGVVSQDLDNGNEDIKPTVQPIETPIEKGSNFKLKNEDSFQTIEKEDLISGYNFGQTLVPFSEEDKKFFNYNKTGKGFKIIGFTSENNIDITLRVGKKSYYVFPDPRINVNNHKMLFQSLVYAMLDKRMVAIVRYGWSDRSNPQIGYLMPIIEGNDILMAYFQLPFDEDVRKYRFPSLKSDSTHCPTDEQLKAIDGLIDSMDLMTDEDGNERLKTEEICDPILQHWFQCLCHRSMSGNDSDLPLLADYLKDLIQPPIDICEKASKHLLQMSQQFSLKASKKRNNLNSSQSTADSQLESKRVRIDENDDNLDIKRGISEVNDLIVSDVPFNQISNKFNENIKHFLNDSSKVDKIGENIIEFIELFRKISIENNDTKAFNELMIDFKQRFFGENIWFILLSKELGLISQTECPDSHVSQELADNYTTLSGD